ncbi:MAG TPA: zinc-ribbon domain-containing protein [Anaerolineae bacterium]|nr:zinc-ribbon domain-containing protein [Anaerolineae bacterium]
MSMIKFVRNYDDQSTECGSKVPAGAKFCSECGTKQ